MNLIIWAGRHPNGEGPDTGAFEYYARFNSILPVINILLLDVK